MTPAAVAALCALAVAGAPSGTASPDVQRATCRRLVRLAEGAGIPVVLVVALAAVESRFDPNARESPRDPHRGALQADLRWCRGETDVERCGVELLRRALGKAPGGDWARAACHYNQGNVCRTEGDPWAKRWAWAQFVEKRARLLAATQRKRKR